MATVIGQFFKNILTSWTGMVIGVAITFFFTPYLISMLGKDQYGIWTLAFSIIAYMGLADMGMKQAIVRYISKFYAVKDWVQLNQVFSSSVRIYAVIAVILAIATLIIVFGLLDLFKIPAEYMRITRIAFLVLGFNHAIGYALLPFTALGAYHRFDITTCFNVGARIAQTLAIVVMLELGYGLVAMAVMVAAMTLLSKLSINYIRMKKYPENRFSFAAINREKTRMLLGYGWFSFLIVATWIVIFQTDNIVIGAFLSMKAVAVYSIAAAIVTQLRSSINIISVPLVPAISHFEAEKDFARIMTIYRKSTRYLYFISTYLCISILFYGGPFIQLWVGPDFIPAILILHILIIAGAVYFPQMTANSVLLGISKHKVAFYILAAEAIANIGLSLMLVRPYGTVGVALGTAIPQLAIYLFVYPYVFYRVMASDVKVFYLTAARSIVYAILLVLPPAFVMAELVTPDSWGRLITDCLVVTAVMLTGLGFFILEPIDRDRLLGKVRRALTRKQSSVSERTREELR
ncbi:MAG: polysaccharide biosynthesis protein [Candidatus Zixiibacteriota bacterium]|nr:MAG: polysaccharide biosynthesis protein [candidate division Zixibacteria bacterium]